MIKANDILRQYGCYQDKPDVCCLAKNMGFKVYTTEMYNKMKEDLIRGMFLKSNKASVVKNFNTDKLIIVEEFQKQEYQRFAIAYLISEYIINNQNNEINNMNEYVSALIMNEYDKEVLNLCRDLLLPDKYNHIYYNSNNISELIDDYEVPDFIMASKVKQYQKEMK